MATSATTELRFRLLGPLEVLKGGESLHLGGERQRGLLALLLLHAERARHDRAPRRAALRCRAPRSSSVRAVRVAVSRLRRLLDDETLVTRPGGYVVYVDPSQLDVAEFEALVMEGRRALERRRPDVGRGVVPVGARALPRPSARRPRACSTSSSRRSGASRSCASRRSWTAIDADLALGRGAELVPELEGLARRTRSRSDCAAS